MSQNTRFSGQCDIDHTRLYRVPAFQPDGVSFEVESVMGQTYVAVTWSGSCPACGKRVRVPEPVRMCSESLVSKADYVSAANLTNYLAQ